MEGVKPWLNTERTGAIIYIILNYISLAQKNDAERLGYIRTTLKGNRFAYEGFNRSAKKLCKRNRSC